MVFESFSFIEKIILSKQNMFHIWIKGEKKIKKLYSDFKSKICSGNPSVYVLRFTALILVVRKKLRFEISRVISRRETISFIVISRNAIMSNEILDAILDRGRNFELHAEV